MAVRSSAANEDTADATAAGQHDTFLGVSGPRPGGRRGSPMLGSLWSGRAVGYRRWQARAYTRIADDRRAGAAPGRRRRRGRDVHRATRSGWKRRGGWARASSAARSRRTPGWCPAAHHPAGARLKDTRIDREGTQIVTREVAPADRERFCLTDEDVTRLAQLGRQIAALLDGPQDIEWAIADGRIWILQARPITSALPRRVPPACKKTTP